VKFFGIILSVLILAGCGQEQTVSQEIQIPDVNAAKMAACSTWGETVVAGNDFKYVDMVYMSDQAAAKFSALAKIDISYEYASKTAYTLNAFNGSRVADNLRPLLLLTVADLKRACLG
jgi:hypothetical protein